MSEYETNGGIPRQRTLPPDTRARPMLVMTVASQFGDRAHDLHLHWDSECQHGGEKSREFCTFYRGEKKGLQIVLSYSLAGPGRKAKQGQEEISHNHIQSFFSALYTVVRLQSC